MIAPRKEHKKRARKWDHVTVGSLQGSPSPLMHLMLGLFFVCLAVGGARE